MIWWQALLLGVVQGITEFLPISSDGHLVLFRSFLDLRETPITFDIFVHAGTLGVILVYFRKQLLALRLYDWFMLGIATIPAAFFGVLIRDSLSSLQQSAYVVAASFFITALFVWLADALWTQHKEHPFSVVNFVVEKVETLAKRFHSPNRVTVTPLQAFLVGLFQALAILPGVSRSGSTLFGSAVVGLKREDAFPFAFVVGVPAILGAVGYDLLAVLSSGEAMQQQWDIYLLGALAAAVSGWFALSLLGKIMQRARLHWFAMYCLAVSILSLFVV